MYMYTIASIIINGTCTGMDFHHRYQNGHQLLALAHIQTTGVQQT